MAKRNKINLEILNGVLIPLEFRNKYYASRSHLVRIKKCCTCHNKFYDTSSRITYKNCSDCRYNLVSLNEPISEEIALKNVYRNKVCFYCSQQFLDRSHPGSRIYCRRCLADYSYDELEKRKTHQRQFNISEFSSAIQNLYDGIKTDSELAILLSTKEKPINRDQVSYLRRKLGLPTIKKDSVRISAGYQSILSLNKEILEDLIIGQKKSYSEIGEIYGVKASTIESYRRKLGAKPKFDGFPTISLTDEQTQYIIGHTLGDGFIRLQKSGFGASFKFSQKADKREYVERSRLVLSPYISKIIDDEANGKRLFPAYGFVTSSSTNLAFLHDDFYDFNLKDHLNDPNYKYPKSHIFKNLTPLSLALWYQDDGSLSFSDEIISISCFFKHFDYKEMCEILSDKFGLNFDFKKNPSSVVTSLIIRGANSRKKFFNLIYPHIHPIMSYKLPRSIYKRHYEAFEGLDSLTKKFNPEKYQDLASDQKIEYINSSVEYVNENLDFPYPKFRSIPLSGLKERIATAQVSEFLIPAGKIDGLDYLDSIFTHRFTANHFDRPSPIQAWKDPSWLKEAFLSLSKYNTPITSSVLRSRILSLVNAPGHFRPMAAAAIYNRYKPKSVLDPMIGWGGRALAAICCDIKKYIGIDLQELSVNGVRKIFQDFQSISKTRVYSYHDDAFNIMKNFSEEFDLIFAGPPYFNTENYNGIVPTITYPEWISSFVIPFCRLSYSSLQKGGYFALHIYDTTRYRFIEPFMEACQKAGFKYLEQLTYGKIHTIGTHRNQYVHIFKKC